MKLVWSAEALSELEGIVTYIAADNARAALALGDAIVETVETVLPENPHVGRPGRVEGTRELVVYQSYIVVYEVNGSINVLTVRHSARLWPQEL